MVDNQGEHPSFLAGCGWCAAARCSLRFRISLFRELCHSSFMSGLDFLREDAFSPLLFFAACAMDYAENHGTRAGLPRGKIGPRSCGVPAALLLRRLTMPMPWAHAK